LIEEFLNRKHKNWVPKEKEEMGVLLILPPSVIPQWEELLFLGGATKPFFDGYSFVKVKDTNNDKIYKLLDRHGKPNGEVRLLSLGLFQTLKEENPKLMEMAEKYDLIVIDEAHKYRNKGTNRWKAVRKLQKKKNGFHNKFILLTATPLNNTIVDIFNLVRLFMDDTFQPFRLRGVDFQGMIRKYKELKSKLKKADDDKIKKELTELSTDIKEKILDEIMVLRTRKYIQEKFKDLKINKKPLIFKDPIPYAVDYSSFFTQSYRELINKIKDNIEHINFEHTKLYGSRFVVFEEEAIGEEEGEKRYIEISDLFKLLLGKRLESSVFAFETTLRRIYEREKVFYNVFKTTVLELSADKIKEMIKKAIKEAKIDKELEELGGEYDVEEENWFHRAIETLSNYGKEKLGEIQNKEILLEEGIKVALEKLEHDLKLMEDILKKCEKLRDKRVAKLPRQTEDIVEIEVWKYKNDPKIETLLQILGPEKYMSKKIKCENLHKRKVVIFTQYRDTAYYIYHNIVNWIENNPELHRWLKKDGKIKVGLVTGDTDPQAKTNYIKRFAPNANDGWKEVQQLGEIEILISTDTLSEGVNLQDGDVVINFDLPWNPMQIVQRVGRVNRIGNEKDVIVVNFIPFEELELIVGILKKLKEKIEDITLVVGKETKILLPEEEITIETFGEKIKEIAKATTTKLEEMGVSEEFKHILPEGMKEHEVDEYKLINFIQYELGLTPEEFKEVAKLDNPPYYTFVKGDSIVAIYKIERAEQEIEKRVIKVQNDEIKEVSVLSLLDLLREKRNAVKFDDTVMNKLKKVKEHIDNKVESFKEELKLSQKGFLAELRKEFLRKRREVKEDLREKWLELINILPLLPYWLYSKDLKKFLMEQGLIKENEEIKTNDINACVEKTYEFLKAHNLPLEKSRDITVTSTILGWYRG
jgi:SNF2 family DNA or RNA helicase